MKAEGGLIIGLLLGAGIGVGAGFMVFGEQAYAGDVTQTNAPVSLDDQSNADAKEDAPTQDEYEALERELEAKKAESERLTLQMEDVKKDLAAANSKPALAPDSGMKAQVEKLQAENAELTTRLSKLEKGETLDDARRAQIIAEKRAKGKSLVNEVETAIAAGDKKSVLAAMDALKKLGTDAAPEFFAAFKAVSDQGGPFGGKNNLKLTMPEFTGLMPFEFQQYALNDPNGDAPPDARIFAAYSTPWQPSLSAEEKVASISKLIDVNPTDATGQHGVAALASLRSPEAMEKIQDVYEDPQNSSSVRATALLTLAGQDGIENMDQQIEDAKFSNDPVIADAGRAAEMIKNPPQSGYLITSYTAEDNGVAGALRTGDLITAIDGAAPGNDWTITAQLGKEGTRKIEVLRNNQNITVNVEGGSFYISGRVITKK